MNRIFRVVTILAAAAACAAAQRLDGCGAAPSADGWVHAPSDDTLGRNLLGAGYTFGRDSLLAALHDSRPDVRSLAAQRILSNGDTAAINALAESLSREKDTCAQGTMQLALGMLGGTLLRSSKQHPGGQIRATPFQACTASEPPVLALSVEQAAGPGNAALGPMVRVTVRNVSNRVVPFFWTASPTEIFSATVLGPDGGRADVPEAQDYLYHPLAELPAPKVKNASGLVLTGVVGGSGPMGLALAPGAEATWDWRVGSDFDMTASGTYRLSLGGTLDYLNTTVCSNTIDVTVK